jgi:hypothetical protein
MSRATKPASGDSKHVRWDEMDCWIGYTMNALLGAFIRPIWSLT